MTLSINEDCMNNDVTFTEISWTLLRIFSCLKLALINIIYF